MPRRSRVIFAQLPVRGRKPSTVIALLCLPDHPPYPSTDMSLAPPHPPGSQSIYLATGFGAKARPGPEARPGLVRARAGHHTNARSAASGRTARRCAVAASERA
ncbi:hypothetical protein JCM9534A_81760 [Catenuloplanes indicus JCM 9534]